MKHKDKIKLARKMLTLQELRNKVSLFDSREWLKRKQAIIDRTTSNEITLQLTWWQRFILWLTKKLWR